MELRSQHVKTRIRNAGAAAIGGVSAGVVMLALVLITAAVMVALVLALAILLADVNANTGDAIVKGVHSSANFFAGSFTDLIRFGGHPKRAVSVNWGIAALVYLLAGALAAKLIFGVGRGGLRFEQRHRASAASP
jgi:hypothetical protein